MGKVRIPGCEIRTVRVEVRGRSSGGRGGSGGWKRMNGARGTEGRVIDGSVPIDDSGTRPNLIETVRTHDVHRIRWDWIRARRDRTSVRRLAIV